MLHPRRGDGKEKIPPYNKAGKKENEQTLTQSFMRKKDLRGKGTPALEGRGKTSPLLHGVRRGRFHRFSLKRKGEIKTQTMKNTGGGSCKPLKYHHSQKKEKKRPLRQVPSEEGPPSGDRKERGERDRKQI